MDRNVDTLVLRIARWAPRANLVRIWVAVLMKALQVVITRAEKWVGRGVSGGTLHEKTSRATAHRGVASQPRLAGVREPTVLLAARRVRAATSSSPQPSFCALPVLPDKAGDFVSAVKAAAQAVDVPSIHGRARPAAAVVCPQKVLSRLP